jgi:hypothetical protein
VQQGSEGLALLQIKLRADRLRARGLWLQACETALLKGMEGVAYGLSGTAKVASNFRKTLASISILNFLNECLCKCAYFERSPAFNRQEMSCMVISIGSERLSNPS